MGVFTSHRHAEESVWAAAFLADHLTKKYGAGEIFIDVHSILGGQEWRKRLLEGVGYTQAVVVLIDSQWTTATEPDGTRRLDKSGQSDPRSRGCGDPTVDLRDHRAPGAAVTVG
jgi:hypothetical protein